MYSRRKGPVDYAEQGGANMQPADSNPMNRGSPSTKLCTNSEMSGTANEQLSAKNIKSVETARTTITRGPVPLYLIASTISSEIHTHGRRISGIVVKRTEYNSYVISLTKTVPQGKKAGGANAD